MSVCNVTVLSGVVGDVSVRLLASGDRLATFGLRVPGPQAKATSVPVVVFDPPAWVEALEEDTEVVVTGSLQRRFFKLASGATGSATEVVASTVVRRRETRRVAGAVRKAAATIEAVTV